jgi:FtsH-binding integral membrane protein
MCLVVIINDRNGFAMSLLSVFGHGRISSIIMFIVLLLVMIGLIFLLHYINPQNIIAANSVWLLLVVLTGIILIPIIFFARLFDVLGTGVLITIIVVIITGLIGYFYGDKIITFDWDTYLNWALIGLILISVFGSFIITDLNSMLSFTYLISIGGLIIFVLLLLSNHKKLKQNAEKCIDGKVFPNYPVESYGIIIKIANIFKDILRILMVKKIRR